MTAIDVTKELSDILTSAFGKGWGWMAVYFLVVLFKKPCSCTMVSSSDNEE